MGYDGCTGDSGVGVMVVAVVVAVAPPLLIGHHNVGMEEAESTGAICNMGDWILRFRSFRGGVEGEHDIVRHPRGHGGHEQR